MIFLFFLILAQAPSFTLPDLDKTPVVLDSLVKNGPVVIDFWATWCKPCIKALDAWKKLKPEFDSLAERSGTKVTFVAINVDGPRTQRKAPLMVSSRGWDFLVLYDDGKVMKLYQVQAIPHTFVIGEGREILYEHIGYKTKDEDLLRDKLLSALKLSEETE